MKILLFGKFVSFHPSHYSFNYQFVGLGLTEQSLKLLLRNIESFHVCISLSLYCQSKKLHLFLTSTANYSFYASEKSELKAEKFT